MSVVSGNGCIPSTSSSEKIITSKNSDISNRDIKICSNNDSGSIEKRSVCGSVQHGAVTQNSKTNFLLPCRPVEGIVGVFRGLGCKDDVRVSTGAVFQASSNGFAVGGFIVQQDRTGDMRELMI